jgi:hypothetical protein
VGGEHLAGDLSVSWLVGAYEAELIASEDGNEPIEQEKGGYGEKDEKFAQCGGGWELLPKPENGCVFVPYAGRGGWLTIVHFSRLSETRLTESCP